MMITKNEVFEMLQEPSTWSGLGFLATSVFGVTTGQVDLVVNLIMAVSGVASMFLPGSKRKAMKEQRKAERATARGSSQ